MTEEIKVQRDISNEERDIRNDNSNAIKESTAKLMFPPNDPPPPRSSVRVVIDLTAE